MADKRQIVAELLIFLQVGGDLGLALARDAQAALRPDLKIVVMSATLDAEPVAAFLAGQTIYGSTVFAIC